MDTLTNAASQMFLPMNFQDLTNAISSPALEAGRRLSVSQAGRVTSQCGPEVVRVSRTRLGVLLMAGRRATAIAAISGRNSSTSSKSATLQSSLGSRLLARLRGVGGTERQAILKVATTPLLRQYCVLTLSEPATKGKGSTGWPTPAARDGKDISRSNAFLSQRERHSPSMATRLLERGTPWTVIS